MPTKTIYVSDSDLPVFDKAQQMSGGNLSSAIAQALRRYVEDEEMDERGFEEVSVEVGKVSRVGTRFIREARVEKRFMGKLVVSWETSNSDYPRSEAYEIYRTPKGRFALYSRNEPNHEFDSDDGEEDPSSEYRLDVYDNLDAMRAGLPEELYEATVQAASENARDGEFLDI